MFNVKNNTFILSYIFNYFINFNQDNQSRNSNQVLVHPFFCAHRTNFQCSAIKLYSINDLNTRDRIGQYLVAEELSSHGHPKSRQMPKTNKMRTKDQSVKELIAHYQAYHSNEFE